MAAPAAAGGADAAAATAPVNQCLNWDGGTCDLHLWSSTRGPLITTVDGGDAAGRRDPLVSCLVNLRIDGALADGRRLFRRAVTLSIRPSPASRFAALPGDADAFIPDLVNGYGDGELPDEALSCVEDTLPLYIYNVAEARARAEVAPFLTEVHADIHVRMVVDEDDDQGGGGGEEEAEGGEGGGGDGALQTGEEYYYCDVAPSSTAQALAQTAATVDGGEGGTRRVGEGEAAAACVICLEKVAGAGREVARLPCAHLFHADCVGRWLRRDGSCPLCRRVVIPRPAR